MTTSAALFSGGRSSSNELSPRDFPGHRQRLCRNSATSIAERLSAIFPKTGLNKDVEVLLQSVNHMFLQNSDAHSYHRLRSSLPNMSASFTHSVIHGFPKCVMP